LLATTQDHHAIDKIGLEGIGHRLGELVREASYADFRKPEFSLEQDDHFEVPHLWQELSQEGYAWGMSIDLTKCIGCKACVVACQAENNVPVVGKEQVARGREMHWLRIDRYFRGDLDNPQIALQPVACHHCENAPCEQVCPVAATVHSHEGLNDMAYNRCIGTRYCANNCPYKVRRFNFFNLNQQLERPDQQLAQLRINPEVSVRARGVMEKCTYCVQRIQNAKIAARGQNQGLGQPLREGAIQTACQQACPTRAIEFGDVKQEGSRVAQAHANRRAYGMLAELNIKPRTKYLARIRNPHSELGVHEHKQEHA
jgi:molybdopterin-containing oxidoreductase family iron-sulfur binding subunit